MDKLEKFILEHKAEFDEAREPEKGWKELEKKMSPQKSDWSILWKVAAVLFFTSTSALLVSKFSEEPDQMASVSTTNSIEDYFVKMIDFKRLEYMSLANESQREELFLDLVELDSAYSNLKASFEQLGKEKLLDAMLENLQLRVYILNEQIEILGNANGGKEEVFHSS